MYTNKRNFIIELNFSFQGILYFQWENERVKGKQFGNHIGKTFNGMYIPIHGNDGVVPAVPASPGKQALHPGRLQRVQNFHVNL